jgi:hypothetical protein
MSLAYKVEELLALRDSVSESAVSIDKFADEDVIKGQFPAFTPLPLRAFQRSVLLSKEAPSPSTLLNWVLLTFLFIALQHVQG